MYLDREVPIVITNVIEKEVPMVEYRERLVPVKEIVEVIKEVEVLKEKEVIREVEK